MTPLKELLFSESETKYDAELRCIEIFHKGILVGSITEESPNHSYQPKESFVVKIRNGDYSENRCGRAKTMFEAKRLFAQKYTPMKEKSIPAEYLPSGEAGDFFPTPKAIAGRMLAMVDWARVSTVLEPSAGKADLLDALNSMLSNNRYGRYGRKRLVSEHQCDAIKEEIDCIEIDENLQYILKGKGYRVVGDDFLKFHTTKWYDLLLMNPPFSAGDQHLAKALSMQEVSGGQIVCLLNAETIKNPYTILRKALLAKLKKYNARIEFVKDAFKSAERSTSVEIAIVYIDVNAERKHSILKDHLQKASKLEDDAIGFNDKPQDLVTGGWIEQMVAAFNQECNLGVTLLKEYAALAPYIMSGTGHYDKPLIQLNIDGRNYDTINAGVVNQYLTAVRFKYWENLFEREEITSLMTSKIHEEYTGKIREMKSYDFSVFNIQRVMLELQAQLRQGVEDSILALFETFTAKHSWYPECEKNIHYYNGWATNKAHKVGMKIILPIDGFGAYSWDRNKLDCYRIVHEICDLERALNYLDSGRTSFKVDPFSMTDLAIKHGDTLISYTWFDVRFYKKGTAHIKFHEDAQHLIDRLNIFAGQNKNWLPPCYGKVHYRDMDEKSKAVIDEFQGEKAYEQILNEKDFYLAPVSVAALPAEKCQAS